MDMWLGERGQPFTTEGNELTVCWFKTLQQTSQNLEDDIIEGEFIVSGLTLADAEDLKGLEKGH